MSGRPIRVLDSPRGRGPRLRGPSSPPCFSSAGFVASLVSPHWCFVLFFASASFSLHLVLHPAYRPARPAVALSLSAHPSFHLLAGLGRSPRACPVPFLVPHQELFLCAYCLHSSCSLARPLPSRWSQRPGSGPRCDSPHGFAYVRYYCCCKWWLRLVVSSRWSPYHTVKFQKYRAQRQKTQPVFRIPVLTNVWGNTEKHGDIATNSW